MKLIKGTQLSEAQIREVKRQYVHRWLAIGPSKAYASEAEWIARHAFFVTNAGRLANNRKFCEPDFMAD